MQMIEVDYVIVHHLRAGDEMPDDTRILGNLNLQRVLDGPDAGDGVHHGAYATNALGPDPGFARIAIFENELDAAEHGAGAPCVGDLASLHLSFDSQVPFNTSDGIDNQACHVSSPSPLPPALPAWPLV